MLSFIILSWKKAMLLYIPFERLKTVHNIARNELKQLPDLAAADFNIS